MNRLASHSFDNAALGGVCFISDLHLSSHLPKTLAQFEDFCQNIAPQFDTLIILGDLFEYWLGDDTCKDNPTAMRVMDVLQKLFNKGKKIGFVAGNRDFLVQNEFARRARITLLPDPCVISIQKQKVLLSHGDLLCTNDKSYQRFRHIVHTAWVQKLFLNIPASWRNLLAHFLRTRSEKRWNQSSAVQREYLMVTQDINIDTAESWLAQHKSHILIHGHTHRPSTHLNYDNMRMVLPDWDCDSETHPRWGYIAWPKNQDKPELHVL